MQTPLSAPVWALIGKFDIPPTSEVFTRWWKKIKTDARFDAWRKLARYLQCLRYFHVMADNFWVQMSTNPTYWSIQKIAVTLTLQANWLKASGLEMREVQTKFYEAAEKITQGEPDVRHVMEHLDGLWPANFKPINLHYDGEPFADTILFAKDDASVCRKMVNPKGLKVPDSFFNEVQEILSESEVEIVQVKPA